VDSDLEQPASKTKLKSGIPMKTRTLAIMAAIFASATLSRADITGTTLTYVDNDVMYCSVSGVTNLGVQDGVNAFQVGVDGYQEVVGTGTIWGNIITDSEADPSLNLLHSIDNDTGFTWTDYHLKITLNKTFSLSNVTVDNGWSPVITAPTQVGSDWIGYIDYYAGTPIINGGTLDFGYTMTFTGGASFSEELTPTVPEPGTFALMACGLAGLLVMRRRF